MSGEFSAANLPTLAGAYFDFESATPQPQIVNTTGVVAIPFTHNWGPANQIVELFSFSEFLTTYGGGLTSGYTQAYTAIRQAFDGEAIPGRGGASAILAYRIVGSSGAKASLVLTNTTPATALTLSAAYPGSWANTNLSVIVQPTPANPTVTVDIDVYVQGVLAETWTFPKTTMATGAALINASSNWITAVVGTDGIALSSVSTQTYLTGGNDGATTAGADWTTMMAAFQAQAFTAFAPADLAGSAYTGPLTPTTLLASLVAWGGMGSGGLNAIGHRATLVVGGASGEAASVATSRSATIADPNFINLGVGTYSDSLLGTLSPSQLAPRLAGIIAARGDSQGLTFARLARLSITTPPQYSDILTGIQTGFMTIGQDSNPISPVRFEKGVTTYITTTNPAMPVAVFGNTKFMLTMQQIERDITEWAQSNVIGVMTVNAATISYVINYVSQYLGGLASSNVIQPGFTVTQAALPVPTSTSNFIALQYQVQFGRDVEQVLNTVIVS
jgi:hypothetical protein